MNDVYITFQGTGREGSVATDTYLIDAAKQLGVEVECDCDSPEPSNMCALTVVKGVALLSKPTKTEIELLSASERKGRRRLACQTKIERPGEIEVMTVQKDAGDEKPPAADRKEEAKEFKREFEEMPLDEKISSLVELEVIALGETLSYIVNSPYEAFGKVMNVLSGFGRDLEEKDRESKVPKEHRGKNGNKQSDSKSAAKTSAGGKKTSKSAVSADKKSGGTSKSKRGQKRGRPAKKKEEGDGGRP